MHKPGEGITRDKDQRKGQKVRRRNQSIPDLEAACEKSAHSSVNSATRTPHDNARTGNANSTNNKPINTGISASRACPRPGP